ncbi:cytochrome c-type biogenesis protein [Shewanella dokdonensis]|uniref:Cytochrome c-type biogenesis protein n=1 Tax=Shewanella dokdonensis TaxID=712036 RepID=A0ABX8DB75_9GAMM|nr:cytochrome c-type biogenesis protein [Shewanella dokdonensis]MCL1075399.1 cytochrome c-type biogenesis protein CcmH [Shewanella dokdonensis]QVK22095.1 cytochrome c-type biogenesis protein CcmH [Shewanella dokdonensis]
MSHHKRLSLLLALALLLSLPLASAEQNLIRLSNDIAKALRCPAAINQSLYESEAPIAAELKAQIYQMLQQGQSQEQIIDFMVQRYGERIRYQPALTPATALLWIAPVLLVLGCGSLLVLGRRQGEKTA